MSSKTILVVDDEPHIAHVVAIKLRHGGFEVLIAGDGEEGLELARKHRPDVIVTDLQMPGLSGLELSERLFQDPATRGVPVLMVTARGHLLSPEELAGTNVKGLMCKPFGPRVLLENVLRLLGGTDEGRNATGTTGAAAA